jgi:hypothetical protein
MLRRDGREGVAGSPARLPRHRLPSLSASGCWLTFASGQPSIRQTTSATVSSTLVSGSLLSRWAV